MTNEDRYKTALMVLKGNLIPDDPLEFIKDISARNALLMGLYIRCILDGQTPDEASRSMDMHR